MKLENLNLTDAPQAGQLLAYTRKEVVFSRYESLTQVKERLSDQELLEIHLFDDDREYRAAASRSGRFAPCEVTDAGEAEDVSNEADVTDAGESADMSDVINAADVTEAGKSAEASDVTGTAEPKSRPCMDRKIETLADFPESGEQVYKEEVLLENAYISEGQTITVLNHISYDERGMAVVDNYRLKMGGKRHG